jgi:hypothetical protein
LTPRRSQTREVCDFLDSSSGHAISTYNQPNLESTLNQPSFFRLKFWALDLVGGRRLNFMYKANKPQSSPPGNGAKKKVQLQSKCLNCLHRETLV